MKSKLKQLTALVCAVAMMAALYSLILKKPVAADIAMTGEITLRGKVMPVGGIKEKVLAAVRAGVREIVLPHRNEPDLEDVPAAAREKVRFHLVQRMSEVLEIALGIDS